LGLGIAVPYVTGGPHYNRGKRKKRGGRREEGGSYSTIVGPRKTITAETAEGAEMIGVNDLPKPPLRSLRALR
jgi:hypothetical protein